MEQLHAFWRMDYIEAPRAPKSAKPFSALPAMGDDRAALIVYRGALSYLMLNRFPYNPGHLLAIPFREVADIEELTPEESADLFRTIILAKKLLRVVIGPDGFNVGFNLGTASGGSIEHLHAHIVPRWNGDTNFMPVIGQTRVLPQALETTWEKLHAEAARLAAS
ncbi:ATP adenylyltransferase [Ereboglobus sp. PH5-5]|uniref:HIT family hydrolase n=1 Tax=Ereboglobus luteus TaxID=1796921 RepID=A0A2U8E200_9BACT|nr:MULTISPECIES: HIT domain-containing protein [Ereboglobus]AWI08908.1 HIT family hydrolase [Ereboglobus luteus]MDF9828625.1 ATP adenylyltransferase [Ereboglobus sp. PH5-10]MDF9833625.1 ATP adenylyltransferase [Ereboglobus sp. PH5-5]